MNCCCETLYSDRVTSSGLSSHLITHLFVYYMYHLFIFFFWVPWVDSLLGNMGSRDHLFDICLYFGVLRINLLTYLHENIMLTYTNGYSSGLIPFGCQDIELKKRSVLFGLCQDFKHITHM